MSKIQKKTQESFVYVAPLYQRCGAPQARPCTNFQGIPSQKIARKCAAPIRHFIEHKYCGMKINIKIGTKMKQMASTSGISGKKA